MSLLKPADPVEIFTRCGSRFLESPDPVNGIEFDDAVVALKRHAYVVLDNSELADTLGQFSRLIRDRQVEQLRPLFEQVVGSLE